MQAHDKLAELMTQMLAIKGYSKDIQNTSWHEYKKGDLTSKDADMMEQANKLWIFLTNWELSNKEPILASSNIVCTPANMEEIQNVIKSIPKKHQGIAYIAVQMTINYINAN